MGTVTITSGVHVGQRGTGSINQGWFAGSPTTQFSPVVLTSVNVPVRTGGQAVVGHADLVDEPIAFEFERRARDVLTDGLAALAVKDLLNGGSRATLSGFRDAVARAGFLANVAWSERRNAGGTESFSVLGACRVVQPVVRGLRESMTLLVFPADVLWWSGTESVFVTPAAYAALDPGEI